MLLNIYLKEMKDCFRDRRTLLLTVFLPIVMMSGLVFFYEGMGSTDEGEKYKLAVDSSFSNDEAAIFEEYDAIDIVKSADPEQTFAEGKAQGALLLNPNFHETVKMGKDASVTMIGDSSSENSSNLMTMVATALTDYEKRIVADRLQAQGTDASLIQPFSVEQKEMSEDNVGLNLIAFLIPMMLALAIGVGAGPAAADLFSGEKEKKTMEALLMSPVSRSTLLTAKWLTISTIGAITGMITLIVVALEITFLTENLKKGISFGNEVYLIIGIAIFLSIIYAMFIASLLMITSIIGKTIKEAQSYSTPILLVVIFPAMMLATTSVNELAFWHFAAPIMNLFSLFKELLLGVIDYEHIFITLGSNLLSLFIIFIICRILFMKDKWVMN
ncbi:ABC transporter permease [Peribacillus psychrosaccharolyticus]|uniref:ABC transporter permease n=1 Tax=Peribacillus psychrosaccharolyticus TaxID=1407 RepID=UPI003D28AC47